jgi:hypothetical protein
VIPDEIQEATRKNPGGGPAGVFLSDITTENTESTENFETKRRFKFFNEQG